MKKRNRTHFNQLDLFAQQELLELNTPSRDKEKTAEQFKGGKQNTLEEHQLLRCSHVTIDEAAEITFIAKEKFESWIAQKQLSAITGPNGTSCIRIIDILRHLISPNAGPDAIRPVTVAIADVVIEKAFQVRVSNRGAVIKAYSEHYLPGGQGLPPIVMVRVANRKILVDGRHRIGGATLAGAATIEAFILPGNESWARHAARELNKWNGLPLTPQDRRRALSLLLDENPWLKEALIKENLSLRAIEQLTGFSKPELRS